jgi:hypothetical protein
MDVALQRLEALHAQLAAVRAERDTAIVERD